MNNFNKYPSYKDSEIEWLEKIPSHWELIRLGSEFEERRDKVSDKDFEALSVTKNGIVPQLENAAKSNDGDNRKGVRKGDFVINSRSDRKGSSGIAYQDGSVSLINIVLKPKSIFPKYSEYLLKSYHFIEEYYRFGHGIVADLWTTRYSEMKAMPIPLPPLDEQTSIANFLDKKTAEIKEFIALKEKTIELLKERKMAIINQAVTKGLDPTVEMKDSGIEWLGEIPKHWDSKQLKHLGIFKNGYAFNSSEFSSHGVRVVKIANVHTMQFKWEEESYIAAKYYKSLPDFRILKGDLVIALTRPIISTGIKAVISDLEEPLLLNQRNAIYRSNKIVNQRWIYYTLLNPSFVNEFDKRIDKTGQQPNISTTEISNIKMTMTDDDEQKGIIKYLDIQMADIEGYISQVEKEIELIKEYQQSLISDVVTGKVDVRGFN